MNIDTLLNKYFMDCSSLPTIEVFDNENIYDVYVDIVKMLRNSPEIELGVLQLLSYCFYEILDNVLIHSSKKTEPYCYTMNRHAAASRSWWQMMV